MAQPERSQSQDAAMAYEPGNESTLFRTAYNPVLQLLQQQATDTPSDPPDSDDDYEYIYDETKSDVYHVVIDMTSRVPVSMRQHRPRQSRSSRHLRFPGRLRVYGQNSSTAENVAQEPSTSREAQADPDLDDIEDEERELDGDDERQEDPRSDEDVSDDEVLDDEDDEDSSIETDNSTESEGGEMLDQDDVDDDFNPQGSAQTGTDRPHVRFAESSIQAPDDSNADTSGPSVPHAEQHASTTDAAKSPVSGKSASRGSAKGAKTKGPEKIQIMDLHTSAPMLQRGGRLYKLEWHRVMGTDLIFQAPRVPPGAKIAPPEEVTKDPPTLLATSNMRLMALPLDTRSLTIDERAGRLRAERRRNQQPPLSAERRRKAENLGLIPRHEPRFAPDDTSLAFGDPDEYQKARKLVEEMAKNGRNSLVAGPADPSPAAPGSAAPNVSAQRTREFLQEMGSRGVPWTSDAGELALQEMANADLIEVESEHPAARLKFNFEDDNTINLSSSSDDENTNEPPRGFRVQSTSPVESEGEDNTKEAAEITEEERQRRARKAADDAAWKKLEEEIGERSDHDDAELEEDVFGEEEEDLLDDDNEEDVPIGRYFSRKPSRRRWNRPTKKRGQWASLRGRELRDQRRSGVWGDYSNLSARLSTNRSLHEAVREGHDGTVSSLSELADGPALKRKADKMVDYSGYSLMDNLGPPTLGPVYPGLEGPSDASDQHQAAREEARRRNNGKDPA